MNTFTKKIASIASITLLALAPLKALHADLEQVQEDQSEIWSTGVASQESTETSIVVSMLGWGLGLAVVIAVVAALVHNSTSSSSSSSSSN